jgi:hypothetical protein
MSHPGVIEMPKYRKLTVDEVQKMKSATGGERARVREEYRGYLEGLNPGEGGELELDEKEKKITIKNRLKRAAEDLGVDLEFRRTGENVVRFLVRTPEN